MTTSTHSVGGGNTGGTINVLVGGISVRMLTDSEASTNVIERVMG